MLAFFLESPIQIVIAAVVILIVFGPQKLPEIAGQIGRALRELKRTTSELQDSFNMDHNRYDDHHNPPSYDSYGNPSTYSETPVATVSETDMLHGSASQAALPAGEPVHGDFAASALGMDNSGSSDYSHGMSAPETAHSGAYSYSAPATATGASIPTETPAAVPDMVPRPAAGSVPRQS